MGIRNVRKLGEECLRKKCKEVRLITPRTKILVEDMFDTMYATNGCGLAAPQVGILKRIVVIDVDGENQYTLINPVILKTDGEQSGWEGCLSVPGKSGVVTRPDYVKVRAMGLDGKEFELEGEGFLARAICHECDHLDGIMYVDKIEGELIDNEELERLEAEAAKENQEG